MGDLSTFFEKLSEQLADALAPSEPLALAKDSTANGVTTAVSKVGKAVPVVTLPADLVDLRTRMDRVEQALGAVAQLGEIAKSVEELRGQLESVAKAGEAAAEMETIKATLTAIGEAVETHTEVLERVLDRQVELTNATAVRKSLDGQENGATAGASGSFDAVVQRLVTTRAATLR